MISKIKNFLSRLRDASEALKAWEAFAPRYGNFVPPNCPSEGDLEYFSAYLKALDSSSKVLILGVTPQLRNLFADFRGEVVIADFSKAMHRASNFKVDPKISGKEKFIRIDWFNLKKTLNPDFFDLILGDLVFVQIGPADRDDFVDNISAVLKPGGFFVTRVKIHNPYWRDVDALEIIRKDADAWALKKNHARYLLYRLGDKILDLKTLSFRSRDFIPMFVDALGRVSDSVLRSYINSLLRNYNGIDITRSYFTQPEFELLASARFKIKSAHSSGDYEESEFFPIYILKKP